MHPASHPSGISPSSESASRSGKRSARGWGRPRVASLHLGTLARTGSKSTNQDLNSARAIASSVWFVRWFSSILSSSILQVWRVAVLAQDDGDPSNRDRHLSLLRIHDVPAASTRPLWSRCAGRLTSRRRKERDYRDENSRTPPVVRAMFQ